MGYVESNLAGDETIVAQIKHSWKGIVSILIRFLIGIGIGIFVMYLPKIILNAIDKATGEVTDINSLPLASIFGYIVGGVIIFTSLSLFVAGITEIACAQLVVTDKRLLGRRGFIRKDTTDIVLSKVDTLNAGNGFLGAIFHYGNIQVVSAASGANKATLRYDYISNTMEFRKAVLEAIEKAKVQEREEQAKAMRDAMKENKESEEA